jgi:regulator of ribonuclease activity A
MIVSTADLCDVKGGTTNEGDISILPSRWRWFGQERSLTGALSTVDARGCNYEIRQALAETGNGRVLFIDADGEQGACIGENLALLAKRNGWGGLIIHGNVRDAAQLRNLPLGIVALGTWPARSENRQGGRRDVPLLIQETKVEPGDTVCADEDGVVILRHR